VFIRRVNEPHADGLLTGLGCDDDEAGFVTVDAGGRTSAPGGLGRRQRGGSALQVITAAGAGSAAAIAINADLVQDAR
jgi:thioredoxin reductase